jgi:hypothetical protein
MNSAVLQIQTNCLLEKVYEQNVCVRVHVCVYSEISNRDNPTQYNQNYFFPWNVIAFSVSVSL